MPYAIETYEAGTTRETSAGGEFTATSVDGAVTGRRGDVILARKRRGILSCGSRRTWKGLDAVYAPDREPPPTYPNVMRLRAA
jgi:hypothetical protein